MNFKLESLIAIRYFRSRRDESFISISSLFSFLGITIGVATLIVVMSVMNGFRSELVNKIVGINGHIILYFNDDQYKKSNLFEEIESINVSGIFDVGMYNFDRNIIFIPKDFAVKLLNKDKNYLSHLEVFIQDIELVNETAEKINKKIGSEHRTYTWETMHKELFNALKIEKKVMFLILSLIIFVAAFNLISSIIMIVKDKERGIGILRSLGLTRGQILRIFIYIGSIVGILGTILGTILGILITINIGAIQIFFEDLFGSSLFAAEIYFFNIIPSKVYLSEVITIVLIALILSLLSTLYPAWRASKIEPANILRYE